MRRKVLQDFANVFPQKFIDLPSDLALLAYLRTGVIKIDIITGKCSYEGMRIPTLQTCRENKSWLMNQAEKHHISVDKLKNVSMIIEFRVTDFFFEKSFGQEKRHAYFRCKCCGEIQTDKKNYRSEHFGAKRRGYDNDYHGLPKGWRRKYLSLLKVISTLGRAIGLISKALPD
jgi:hypothetical protein